MYMWQWTQLLLLSAFKMNNMQSARRNKIIHIKGQGLIRKIANALIDNLSRALRSTPLEQWKSSCVANDLFWCYLIIIKYLMVQQASAFYLQHCPSGQARIQNYRKTAFFWILLPLHLTVFWKPPNEILTRLRPVWQDHSAKCKAE